jgi:hypothetical protein|tara:strand:+ start:2565 stop:6569 length:4005 start_codon:yes stop_codon:yes gene_type:complete
MNEFLNNFTEGLPSRDTEFIEQQKALEELRKQEETEDTDEATATSEPAQPQVLTPEEKVEQVETTLKEEEKEKDDEDEDEDDQSAIEFVGELAAAAPVGVLDFGADLLNLVPGVEIEKVPEFESEITQTVREMSSIIIPTIGLSGLGTAALAGRAASIASKASKASKLQFLVDPMVKKVGGMAFSAGTGAFVDYTVEINQTDDNLTGVLKQTWPRFYGWIPDDLATLASDGADMKRAKNVTEGVYLGVGTDLLVGAAKLLNGRRGLTTNYIPKNEKAGQYAAKYNAEQALDPEESVNFSAAKRSQALDDLGKWNLDEAVEKAGGDVELALSEPIYGVHDLYGAQEVVQRSLDGDVNLAAVDAWQVATNKGGSVNGRVGSMITEPFLKDGLKLDKDMTIMLKGIGSQLKDTKMDVKFPNGDYATAADIAKVGDEMATEYMQLPWEQVKKLFMEDVKASGIVDRRAGVEGLSEVGMEAARKMIKQYTTDLMNLDDVKAETYLATSLAGQVSDIAQGVRMTEGTPAIDNASNLIIDRIEYLMAMRGRSAYIRGRALNLTNMWNRLTASGSKANQAAYAKRIDRILKEESNETLRAIDRIRLDAKFTADTLREIRTEKPEFFAPLIMAYEFTDGKVNTMVSLNKFLKKSTGIFRNSLVNDDPGTQSVILNAFWSNVYNSTLSAFATPIKAGFSNMAGLVEKPLGALIGSQLLGDTANMRRALYQYNLNFEVLQDSLKYMGDVFKRSATELNVADLQRENITMKNQEQIEILEAIAVAKDAEGDSAPLAAVERIKAMNDLANHPWLRFGNRAMQALDGFTQNMIMHAEIRGRAFDKVTNNGAKEFDGKLAESMYAEIKKEMFDEDGLIKDEIVRHTAGELAMSLDNELTNSVSGFISRFPVLKPFVLFTKTPINDLILAKSYSPHNLFMKEYRDFRMKPNELPMQQIDDILRSRGMKEMEVNKMSVEEKYMRYGEIRADLYGRTAIGTLTVMGALGLFVTDRITGNGLADKQKQALRRETGWKPRSIRLPGGNWISYDNLGPVSNWFAAVADVADNMDSLTPNDMAEQFRKLGFILAASITDKSFMAGLEPFMDVARGDVGALSRWGGQFAVAANVPGSSLMAEMGRLMDPGLKEVESTILDMARNRLPLFRSQLPQKYDWIDGDRIGYPDKAGNTYEGFMTRVWNNYMPWKISGKISDEKKFLQMVEYDALPRLRTNGRGVELTPDQRSEITNIMGQRGFFKEGIKRVMKTTTGKEFRKKYMKAVNMGFKPDINDVGQVHRLLDAELRLAMRMASALSSDKDVVARKMAINQTVEAYLEAENFEAAERFLKMMEEYSY